MSWMMYHPVIERLAETQSDQSQSPVRRDRWSPWRSTEGVTEMIIITIVHLDSSRASLKDLSLWFMHDSLCSIKIIIPESNSGRGARYPNLRDLFEKKKKNPRSSNSGGALSVH